MALKFRDLPNKGKYIVVTSRSELKADGEIAMMSLAKKNQILPVLNTTTGEKFSAYNGAVYPESGIYSYSYDFATDGGAVGNIVLNGPKLQGPIDIIDGYYDVTRAITSDGSAQISLGTSTSATTNLKAAAVLGTNGTAGRKILVPDFHVNGITNIVDISADGAPVMAVTVAALTAGAFELFLVTRPRVN